MYIALNSKKQRIHISNALEGDKYYCPVCDEEVIKIKGTINAHHFAHLIRNKDRFLDEETISNFSGLLSKLGIKE